MKLKNIVLGAVLAIGLAFLSGCSDKYYEVYQGSTEILSEQITVKESDWWWSGDYQRYEATFDVDHINEDVFEYGEVNVSLFLEETQIIDGKEITYEVLKFLPFSRVFYESTTDEDGKPIEKIFTEQFGFDYQVGKITFYIENSDKEAKPQDLVKYTFKVSSILDDRNL